MVELFTSTGEGFSFDSMIARFSFASTGKCNSMIELFTSKAEGLTQRLYAFLSPQRANVTPWANYLPQRVPQRAKALTQRSNLSRTIYLNGRRL